jgi:hypothetical protein
VSQGEPSCAISAYSMTAAKLVYSNKAVQVVGGAFFLFSTAGFIGQGFDPGKGGLGLQVLSAISAAVTSWLTGRCLVAPSITATLDGVRVRTWLRTRKYSWAEIDHFQVRVVRLGLMAYRHKILGVVLKNGNSVWFSQVRDRPERSRWADKAVVELNSYAPN